MRTLRVALDRVAAAVLLLGYGGWLGAVGSDAVRNPNFRADAWLGSLLIGLQAVPCIVLGLVVAVDVLTAGRSRFLRLLSDIAIFAGVFVVLSYGVVLAIVDIGLALPSLAVGALLIGTLVWGRLPRSRRR